MEEQHFAFHDFISQHKKNNALLIFTKSFFFLFHIFSDPYATEYTPQYMIPSHEAEYAVRSSVLVDGGDRFGVSAVGFDKFEELIWMGNQGVSVTLFMSLFLVIKSVPGAQNYCTVMCSNM